MAYFIAQVCLHVSHFYSLHLGLPNCRHCYLSLWRQASNAGAYKNQDSTVILLSLITWINDLCSRFLI